ncbi:MAG TPA: ribonuclease Z [Dongiaceae bacterium]|nr:ribonuclease Z [Dongiaceae bacterium]
MILTVVGSGTLVPSARRSSPALAITCDDFQATVDGGSGTLRRQAELGFDFRKTSALFFTHIHPDHTLDVLAFLFAQKVVGGESVQGEPVEIVGPPGFERYLEHLREGVRPWTDGGERGFRVVELEAGDVRRFGPVLVEAVRLEHAVVDHGYRFRSPSGGVAAFTGDTAWCDNLNVLAREADLLIAECSGSREHTALSHLSAPEVGRVATEAGVKQVVLTHLFPLPDDRVRLTEVAEEYSGPVLMAEDGTQFWV